MKKMLFSAIAMVAFTVSANAATNTTNFKSTSSFYLTPQLIQLIIKYQPCFAAMNAVDAKFEEWGNTDTDFANDIKAKVWQDCTNSIDK